VHRLRRQVVRRAADVTVDHKAGQGHAMPIGAQRRRQLAVEPQVAAAPSSGLYVAALRLSSCWASRSRRRCSASSSSELGRRSSPLASGPSPFAFACSARRSQSRCWRCWARASLSARAMRSRLSRNWSPQSTNSIAVSPSCAVALKRLTASYAPSCSATNSRSARGRLQQQAYVRGRIAGFLEEHPAVDPAELNRLRDAADLAAARQCLGGGAQC
jgi:hypothetical protein